MKRINTLLAAAFAAATMTSAASATIINFAAEADNNGERGVADGTIVNSAFLGGLNLQLSAGVGAVDSDFAYFASSGPGPRLPGLGTCTALNKAKQCVPSNDDNVAPNEWVRVDFVDGPFNVRKLSFNGQENGVDTNLDSSSGLINITTSLNGVVSMYVLTFAQAVNFGFGFVDWILFANAGSPHPEFLVAKISDIPVPAALPLLLSGLAGLAFAARRRRRA